MIVEKLLVWSQATALTQADRAVGSCHQFHGEGEVLQVVGEQAEGLEFLKRNALQEKEDTFAFAARTKTIFCQFI